MFMTDLFSHHRRNHLPYRNRTFWELSIVLQISFSSSTGHNCSVHCLHTSIKVHWKTYNYLTVFISGGLLIFVHLLEASGTKYIQGFFSSLPPTKKLPRDMSHETEYFSFIHLWSSHNGSQSLLINSLTLYLESKKICIRILKYVIRIGKALYSIWRELFSKVMISIKVNNI